MDKRLRHIALLVMTALLTAACDHSSDTQTEEPEPMATAIGFNADMSEAVSRTATRAAGDGEIDNAALKASGFGVYCWYTGTADFTTPKPTSARTGSSQPYTLLMRNQKVEWKAWDGVTDAWGYAPAKYWPMDPNEKLTFRAYAPYTDYLVTDDGTGMPLLPVVVDKDDYHNGTQHDPLWGTGRSLADVRYGSHYQDVTYNESSHRTDPDDAVDNTTDGIIHWYFHHGMAKLVFFAKLEDMGSDEEVYITNITIGPLYDKGLLNISSLAASSSDKPTWDVSEGGDMNVTLYGSDDTHSQDLDTYTIIKDTKDGLGNVTESGLRLLTTPGLLIIPRTYDSTTPLTISVSYKRALDDDNVFTVSTTIDSQTFVGNTVYTLNMNVSSALNVVIESVNAAFTSWSEKIKENYEVYNW